MGDRVDIVDLDSAAEVSVSSARVVVDKRLLLSFYMHPTDETTEAELAEINKVISIVLNTHFGKYYRMFDDLRSQALATIIERHDRFDSKMAAYPYLYTMIRNEAGNLIRRLLREDDLEVLPPSHGRVAEIIPSVLDELLPFLSGDSPFTRIEIPHGLVGPFLVFCQRGLNKKQSESEAMESVIGKLVDIFIF